MRVHISCMRAVITAAIALMLVSDSEAGLWRRSRAVYQTSYQAASREPVASQTVAGPNTAGLMPISVSNAVVVPTSDDATTRNAPSTCPPPIVSPSVRITGSWSVRPQSYSDYGKYPPYYH